VLPEPPDADRHVRWCGSWGLEMVPGYPIRLKRVALACLAEPRDVGVPTVDRFRAQSIHSSTSKHLEFRVDLPANHLGPARDGRAKIRSCSLAPSWSSRRLAQSAGLRDHADDADLLRRLCPPEKSLGPFIITCRRALSSRLKAGLQYALVDSIPTCVHAACDNNSCSRRR
jgi:hypothetical protein